jgi:hypothetical protein
MQTYDSLAFVVFVAILAFGFCLCVYLLEKWHDKQAKAAARAAIIRIRRY